MVVTSDRFRCVNNMIFIASECYCGCVYGAHAQGVNLIQVKKEALEFLKEHRDYSHIPFKVLEKE